MGIPLRRAALLAALTLAGHAAGGAVRVGVDESTGLPARLDTTAGGATRHWLQAAPRLTVRRESTATEASPAAGGHGGGPGLVRAPLASLGLTMASRWSTDGAWSVWDVDFQGVGKRTGHTIILDLPVLAPALSVFTPGDRGVVDLALLPTFRPIAYGVNELFGRDTGRAYVLPLASVFDPATDTALTVALPPDINIPHFQVEWIEARTLRLTLSHRAMGGGKPAPLRLLFTTHPADARAVVAAYAARYPAYFEAPLPRGVEGSFYYHHIQNHPDFAEMERQNVRSIWSSFWFTHLGDYLPDQAEWYPFTYARLFNLHETMTDRRINGFIAAMHGHRIGVFAYFNVTEYGGTGGRGGDTAEADRRLRERFANALIHDAQGRPIPTWEGAMAMNARRQYALWPFLEEQIRRHLERLPDLDGFVIDRLDWAGTLDHAHDDGQTMVGDQPVDNMAGAVSEAVREVCRLSHAAGKRVLVNQFARVEVMRDVDGTCHEADFLPQRYLTPFRPAAAWAMYRPYWQDDLAPFEAHLKKRLQIALLPHMIAHAFPISQQRADARAADLQELFTPLFRVFAGKREVLVPHCVAVTGGNDVNLFTDARHRYLVPVTSRTRFLTRGDRATEPVEVTIATPEALGLTWALALPLGDTPYRAGVTTGPGKAVVRAARHGAATMIVAGSGPEPPLETGDAARLAAVRDARFPRVAHTPTAATAPPAATVTRAVLRITGTSFYHSGPFQVQVNGTAVGTLNAAHGRFPCSIGDVARPEVRIVAADEGAWFLPGLVQLAAETSDRTNGLATWEPGDPIEAGRSTREIVLPLRWRAKAEEPASAVWIGRDRARGGAWEGTFGAVAAWVAGSAKPAAAQNGFRLHVTQGRAFTWAPNSTDPRVPAAPASAKAPRVAACWFDPREVACDVMPGDGRAYRLTVYLLDHDRADRSVEASLVDRFGEVLDVRAVPASEMGPGVYLSWTVTGAARVRLRYTGANPAANAVLSAVLIDR
jgi:hypothetical protein